jgi:hypothetical protein
MARYEQRIPRARKEIAKRKALANDPTFVHLARCGDVYAASLRYGMSRRSLFRLAKLDPRSVRRLGTRTVWDFAILDTLIDKLPLASEAPAHQLRNLPAAADLSEMRKRAAQARSARKAKAEAAAAEGSQA